MDPKDAPHSTDSPAPEKVCAPEPEPITAIEADVWSRAYAGALACPGISFQNPRDHADHALAYFRARFRT